tara:strand:+ start:489 stop:1898 length:1410 start_codon:yes stop_codon:yes gene_type:complete
LLEQQAIYEARDHFWRYRKWMRPGMHLGWWQREIAHELQQFRDDLVAGKRPKLVIEAPPQHGKSEQVVDFVTWLAGNDPDLRVIYTSFSGRLGIRANVQCQRIYSSDRYRMIFPGTQIAAGDDEAIRNREMIEYVGREGYFRNTTVLGSITGESLDVGIIDDPIKGRENANSITIRDKTWDWFTDDFFSRFSESAGLLAILTRWHIDDPIGRLKDRMGDQIRVVSYPAIANRDEKHRKAGEALFPEHKSLDFLLERKATMASVNWEALYQQNPQIVGGELLRPEWFGRYTVLPVIKHRAIYADTAQKTAERNDYSVFQCWGKGDDGKLYLIDMIRGRWEAPDLRRRAIDFWRKHVGESKLGPLRAMKVEDAASGTGLIQELKRSANIPISGIIRTKDKYTRMLDVLGYIEAGKVAIPDSAPFVSDFLAEAEAFTADDSHMHDDQLDPMMDAITDLLITKSAAEMWARMA